MSLIISNIALHFISKKEESNEVTLRLGPEDLTVSDRIQSFIESLHSVYNNKGSKAYGHFSSQPKEQSEGEESNQPFVEIMEDYLAEHKSFFQFSALSADLLKSELAKYDIAETGYLVLCHYEYMGGRYLMIAIIPISEHYTVDGELNISANQHLDTAKLQLAVRIDLFDYQQNADGNRYISFIKGRAGRKVSDFFLDFLHCEEGLDTKVQTQTLVQAVEDYVAVNQLDADEKQQTRKELLNYCKEQKEIAQDVSIKEIDQVISKDDNEQGFYEFCQSQAYDIEDSFPHEQAIINKVTKYSGYGNGISVSFERGHFGKDVVYNQAADTLIIHKVPPNLKDQLLKLIASEMEHHTAE